MKLKLLFIVPVLAVSLMGPLAIFAQSQPVGGLNSNPAAQTGPDGGIGSNDPNDSNPQTGFQIVTCSGVIDERPGADPRLQKECNYAELLNTAKRLIQYIMYLVIPIVLGIVLFVGFSYLTAGGDSGKLTDAKKRIKPLILGIFFIFGAWLIVYTILDRLLVDAIGDIQKSSIVPADIR